MDQDQRTEEIHALDIKYQSIMHQTDLVVKDEEARRQKLRVMILRDEAATLRDQLADKDTKISKLSDQYDDVRVQLDRMNQTCIKQEAQLRSQTRQQSELKAELLCASNLSEDSAKILAEKLALSRELAVLKPEVDHLRSQLSHQKDVLAEKLALERQLSTLEVELANEKRAVEKALQRRESRDNEAEDELRSRVADLERKLAAEQKAAEKAKKMQDQAQSSAEDLRQQVAELEKKLVAEQKASEKARKAYQKVQSDTEGELRQQVAELEKMLADEKRAAQKAKRSQDSDGSDAQKELQEKVRELEKELASEKRETERAQRSSEKEAAASRDQIEMLTQRIDEFKGKLRETRAELKGVRAELTQARTTTTSVPVRNDEETKKPLSKAKAGKARRANEISVDEMMLDTPGHTEGKAKRALKKRGVEHTTVGEKSTFSITPFLNKSNTITLNETIEEEAEEPSILEGKGDPAAPIIEPEVETGEDMPAVDRQPAKSVAKALQATKPKAATANQKKVRGRPKAQALTESSPNKIIAPGSAPTLEKVVEEPEETGQENGSKDNVGASKKAAPTIIGSADTSNATSDNPEPKKKKRKLLGASNKGTLFDQDEDAGEAEPPVPTVASAAIKRKPIGIKASARKGPVAAVSRGAFPRKSFSPLKKHRRGVGASFLA